MNFDLTEDQLAIREAVTAVCADFGDDYWLRKDREGGFPEDFYFAMAKAGWLGIAMPTEFGGAGLGISEAALMMEAVSASGAGLSGASAIHMRPLGGPRTNVSFGVHVFSGSAAQQGLHDDVAWYFVGAAKDRPAAPVKVVVVDAPALHRRWSALLRQVV